MKTISILYFVLFNLSIFSCAQEKTINKDSQKMFTEFTQKDKFNKDESLFYTGLEDKNIQSNLTKEINKLAKTFESIQSSKNPSSDFYLKAIESSLKTIEKYDLDTENRTRVANYIEELMDIVELESSNGLLNNYVYGFDPTKK
ncbi:DUF4844 domain-containing protein [Empedobacter sp. UBA7620]|uniref:DUF4844 domain-containing protein n=1 Tax=Empedobacter sp. UBA7620 TaxID=1946452 RepID=UPI0025BD7601|nr:DUF4844 domain-containing protein [Empedobacter sp. UBA7620]